jgi:two-component system chemotaxis response regulator CheY
MANKRILIVDDEKDVVDILQTMLEDLGYTAYAAYDGVEGLEKIKLIQPDLIILDINMPRLGGIGVYHEIYDREKESPMYPVIILSARYQAEKLFDGLKAEGFCAKPFKLDELLGMIESALAKNESHVFNREKVTCVKPYSLNKILIIERNLKFSKELKDAFKSSNCKAITIDNTFMAVEQAILNQPDLILIQIQLDDMKGDELAYKLKQMPELQSIPTLIYTHSGEERLAFPQAVYESQGISPLITHASCVKLVNEVFRYMDMREAG